MSVSISTKSKILNAAEQLFAMSGFAETSMRAITQKAGVNLASINYHFGSKKALTVAVIDRYLSQLMPQLQTALIELQREQKPIEIAQMFQCFIQPLLDLESINRGGTVCFLRLLGRGYVDVQGHLRRFITDKYRLELAEILTMLHSCAPHLTEEQLFWQVHFSLGTSVFTLAASDALIEITKSDFQQEIDTEQILERLLPFLSAGFSAQLATPRD